MRGKITVMTIITGVHSPWLLGKENAEERKKKINKLGNELNLEII